MLSSTMAWVSSVTVKGRASPAPVSVQKDVPGQQLLQLPAGGGFSHAHGAAYQDQFFSIPSRSTP